MLSLTRSTLELFPRNPQRHPRPIRHSNRRTALLGRREPRRDEPECDRVRADTELRTPFFGDGFGEAYYACFGDGVVYLAASLNFPVSNGLSLRSEVVCGKRNVRIPMNTRRTTNINNNTRLAVPEPEVWGCRTNEFEGGCVVHC